MLSSIKNEYLKIVVNSKGAELCSLKTLEKEYMWNGNPDFWRKHSPILFPIVGTLKNNSYQFKNKNYQVARHGFARDFEFELIENQERTMIFSLKANNETLENYPFDFELQIKYTLDGKKLSIQYKVINNSGEKMPFSIGAHPAFSLPNGFENYSFEFSDNEILEYHLLENGLIANKTEKLMLENNILPLKYKTFENDALVFKTLKSKSITVLENAVPYIKVKFDGFPNLGIWTILNSNFICIEPWFGYSDKINSNGNLYEKEGIIILDINQFFKSEFSIEII